MPAVTADDSERVARLQRIELLASSWKPECTKPVRSSWAAL